MVLLFYYMGSSESISIIKIKTNKRHSGPGTGKTLTAGK
jgi:hypothetical protein